MKRIFLFILTNFAVMAVLNLWVAYTFDTDTWVSFKLFGGIGLMVVFVIGQALYLNRFITDPAKPDETAAKPGSGEQA